MSGRYSILIDSFSKHGNRLKQLSFFILLGVMCCLLGACGAKTHSGSLFSSRPDNSDFLTETPLKKLSARQARACVIASLGPDDVLDDNLFELAELESPNGIYEKILRTAYSQLGLRYRRGGSSPRTGFDCSGFTAWVFDKYGIDLPRSSREQYHIGRKVKRSNLKKGDLVFFRTRGRRISHVGIYLEDGKFIHSPRTGRRIHVSSLDQGYWGRRYVGGRRVVKK